MKKLFALIVIPLMVLALCSLPASAATPLTKVVVANGLSSPLLVTAPADDTSRIFILEQPGRIRVVKNGSLLPTPFLDITAKVSFGGERGLLGMAFHPEYAVNGYFYLYYTNNSGATTVSRFNVSGNPDLADGGSELILLSQSQPYSNHNGGMIAFGPNDGYLYIGLGDGGSGGDPGNRSQNGGTWLGKMLRIDVDGGSPYAVPIDNPFVGNPAVLDEIWAKGLRNPWRFSFDRANADLYIADVGQYVVEEIDFQAGSSSGGENYGWRLMEGTHCYNPSSGCDTLVGLTDPIYEYLQTDPGNPCSVTGGYVYRGCAIPDLQGTYFFGDYCSAQIWSFRFDGSNVNEFQDRTAELGSVGNYQLSSFGEDARGELYICALSAGIVYKIVPDGPSEPCASCCTGIRGNVNGKPGDEIDVSDLTYLVDYLFRGGLSPPCDQEADVNNNGGIDVADLTYIVDYLFRGGPAPVPC